MPWIETISIINKKKKDLFYPIRSLFVNHHLKHHLVNRCYFWWTTWQSKSITLIWAKPYSFFSFFLRKRPNLTPLAVRSLYFCLWIEEQVFIPCQWLSHQERSGCYEWKLSLKNKKIKIVLSYQESICKPSLKTAFG